MLNNHVTSKAEIAKELNLSMPTVLANVNDLLEKMVLEETGEYASTGGRKAKSIGINKSYCHAMGILITANHIEMVLVNLGDEIIKKDRIRLKFTAELSYCTEVAQKVKTFLEGELAKDTLLGIGVAIPGIIDQKERIVLKSHALGIENYSLRFLEQALEIPVYFENDANAAMLAEKKQKYPNAIYLSLNHTLGGAFCIDGKLFRGQNQKAGEFGHMILVPGGRKCYCGKSGCADAYCAASVLTQDNRQSLDAFMEKIESGDEKVLQTWNEYLDHLAVLISNLRMAYDMDIILGGDVGGVLSDYMIPLGEKVMAYNGFEHDVSYLKNCTPINQILYLDPGLDILPSEYCHVDRTTRQHYCLSLLQLSPSFHLPYRNNMPDCRSLHQFRRPCHHGSASIPRPAFQHASLLCVRLPESQRMHQLGIHRTI